MSKAAFLPSLALTQQALLYTWPLMPYRCLLILNTYPSFRESQADALRIPY
jgi:hypothetical protein